MNLNLKNIDKIGLVKLFQDSIPSPVPASKLGESASDPALTGNEQDVQLEASRMPRLPSLDEMVANTLEPMVKTTGNNVDLSNLLNPLTELRYRNTAMGPCGKIKIGLSFDTIKEELKVTIYEAKGLPGKYFKKHC